MKRDYATEFVECSTCTGSGDYFDDECLTWSRCATCNGSYEVEVCAQCHDSGDPCSECGTE